MVEQTKTRVAVITGASSGIGKEAAKALVQQGWRVIGLGRDAERCAAAEAEIRALITDTKTGPDAQFDMLRVDLSSMADTARMAGEIFARTPRIDVLLNNAGGMAKELVITPEGNEALFAGNHLGHFLLTDCLLPLLKATAKDAAPGSVRIINVSSDAHEYTKGLEGDIQMIDNFIPGAAYCRVKLANILFTRQLAKRIAGTGVITHSMHPGIVASNFVTHADPTAQATIRSRANLAISPEEGADTLIWLATAEEPGKTNGGYFVKRKETAPSAAAQDVAAEERLWTESEQLVARSLKAASK